MGSVAGEAIFVPKTISAFLREVSVIGDVSEKVSRVNSFVDALEEEVRRIDALKRELPLCMLLLKDAILVLKEERLQRASLNKVPVLVIPVKKTSGEDNGQVKRTEDSKDMKNWMSSVQLWKTEDDVDAKENLELESCKINDKVNQGANQDIFQTYKSRSAAGTFILFKGCTSLSRKEEESPAAGPGLSLFTPGNKSINEEDSYSSDNGDRDRAVCVSSSVTESSLRRMFQPQNDRKQRRRCWSPELHRCFVNALQQLGGSEAATPKNIRELMQVDGLTNDEVKSHLQKYRLHTKRIGTARATLEHQSFLGSLWMPQDPYVDSLKPTSSQSGSPQGPLQLTGNTGGTSITGGDSTEDGEDAKSEGYSWKGSIHR